MNDRPVTIQSFIDARLFSDFAWFDLLCVQRRWRRPAIFAVFFAAVSLVAFSRADRVEHAALLGGVLLAVGLGLPLAYFGGFYLSVRRQSAAFTGKDAAYVITLDARGMSVSKGKQSAAFLWKQLDSVHRLARCVCVYTDPRHAFLLPSADNSRAVPAAWELITANLDSARVCDHRGRALRQNAPN